jgi:metallo-beta-lactamase family protein
LIVEATYGDRDRPSVTPQERQQRLGDEVREAAARKGALLIPAFAVERTQELIVDLIDLIDRSEVPSGPIFLDSPLAIRATEVFRDHATEIDSKVDVKELLNSPHLRFTETVEESKALEKISGFHIIISASGMCEAGRIRHHLKRWLWRSEATVLIVGFQARGTLGRFLLEGARSVRIQGEEIKVNAKIRSIDEYSGHADGPELARWIASRRPIHRGVFLVHGEEASICGLFNRISDGTIPTARVFRPALDDIFDLTTSAPTPLDACHRRRLTPDKVVTLDWHNDMSKFILDLNERMESAADDRARGVVIRRLRHALEAPD